MVEVEEEVIEGKEEVVGGKEEVVGGEEVVVEEEVEEATIRSNRNEISFLNKIVTKKSYE